MVSTKNCSPFHLIAHFVSIKKIRVCRVYVASLHAGDSDKLSNNSHRAVHIRNHVRHQLRSRIHSIFEEIDNHRVETVFELWIASKCLL